ncbi:SMC-Scp complex subunit ScpB [Candidatus Woesearchaeota archaeon]|nr:SMC-Scp complex subunit ScpB [Candidatus Woesearchaeota archaeon]
MQDIKNKIEAVLFTIGRHVDLDELSQLTGMASKGSLSDAMKSLVEDYKKKEGSLEITEDNGKFKLNIKKDYLYLTTQLLDQTEFDKPTQETLALIAYKQPVMQSEVIKIRGNTAYDHVKKLKEMEFIGSEKSGRTRLLKTTPKFYDYFDVVGEELKQKLENIQNEEKTS